MKKWIALLLAALLVMSLAACSHSTPAENQNTATEPAADAPATDSAAPESTEPEVDFEAGTVENNTYTSSLLGITATLDENWYFLDREEIDQIYGITSEAMDCHGPVYRRHRQRQHPECWPDCPACQRRGHS